MKFEILFFTGPDVIDDKSLVYQVDANSIADAFHTWSNEWFDGIAYCVREGWVSQDDVVKQGERIKPIEKPLSGLASRLVKRQQEKFT